MSVVYAIYTGEHELSFSKFTGKLLNIGLGGRRGLRTDLENFHTVKLEILQSYPTAGKAAGIPEDVFDHFVMCNTLIDGIDEKLAIARQQVEVLEDSRAFYVDARQNDIAMMVDAMKSRAQRRKDWSILVPFESAIAYVSQTGDKAAKTRKQKAAEAEQEAQAEAEAENEHASALDMKAELEAYKAELEAKFNESVARAVEKQLAEAVEKKLAETVRAPAVS